MSGAALALLIGLIALGLRLWIGLASPDITWDSGLSMKIADNIHRNLCVSLDPPADATCTPHWGGNHLPGYPAFMAVVRMVGGWFGLTGSFIQPDLWRAVVWGQSLLFAAAAVYLSHSLWRATRSPLIAGTAGLLVAASPITAPWARFILAETLASAAVLILIAELALSLAAGRLRIWGVGLSLAGALFLRNDSVFLLPAVAVVALFLHGPRAASSRLALVGLVIAVPLAGWWGRSVGAGLPPVPPIAPVESGWRQPVGFWKWTKSWAADELDLSMAWWHVPFGNYDKIRLPVSAFDASERQAIGPLMSGLFTAAGRDIPAAIDDGFAQLADHRTTAKPWLVHVELPVIRMWRMWSFEASIYNFGWPRADDYRAVGKWSARWRNLLLGANLLLLIAGWAMRAPRLWLWPAVAVTAALTKTALHGLLGLVEPRYLMEIAPLLEVAIVLSLAALPATLRQRRETGAKA